MWRAAEKYKNIDFTSSTSSFSSVPSSSPALVVNLIHTSRYPAVLILTLFTVLTSCVYGAFLPTYPTPKEEDELNGNKFLYHLLKTKNRIFPPVPMTAVIHNRDNALAHVRALSVPPLEEGRKKRFIISSGDMKWDDAVRYLSEKRPEVRARLPDLEGAQLAREHFKLDTGLSEEYLGIGPGKVGEGEGGVIGWKEMLVESVDFILAWEKKMGITDA